jgi:hypothetical protein
MARIIEKIVEAVIEDPVVDIFAEPAVEGNDLAGLVPAINSGPVIGRGRFHQTGVARLPEERSSGASDQSNRSAPETDIVSTPPKPGPVGEASSTPEPSGYTPSRSPTPSNSGKSNSNNSKKTMTKVPRIHRLTAMKTRRPMRFPTRPVRSFRAPQATTL